MTKTRLLPVRLIEVFVDNNLFCNYLTEKFIMNIVFGLFTLSDPKETLSNSIFGQIRMRNDLNLFAHRFHNFLDRFTSICNKSLRYTFTEYLQLNTVIIRKKNLFKLQNNLHKKPFISCY